METADGRSALSRLGKSANVVGTLLKRLVDGLNDLLPGLECPEGGELRVITDTMNSKIEILVQDTGTGISRENVKKIYDPFFTTKAAGKGTGLGLSVSYGIVQEHGGTISVESKPGVGTSFRLELPLVRKTVNV